MQLQRTLLAALCASALLGAPAWAAINPNALGAAYDATKANVSFKVYSSKATRIELYLYSTATGTAEKLNALLSVLEPFGIREIVQSGTLAIGRGSRSMSDRALRSA